MSLARTISACLARFDYGRALEWLRVVDALTGPHTIAYRVTAGSTARPSLLPDGALTAAVRELCESCISTYAYRAGGLSAR
jgi:hypothetical protein